MGLALGCMRDTAVDEVDSKRSGCETLLMMESEKHRLSDAVSWAAALTSVDALLMLMVLVRDPKLLLAAARSRSESSLLGRAFADTNRHCCW